jgi:hypothetical protein
MPRALTTPTLVTIAAVALAAGSAGCGADAASDALAPPSTAQIAARLDGLYTARISRSTLGDAGPGAHVPAGMWVLRVDVAGRTVHLTPPNGGQITLRITSVAASRVWLAPNIACESRTGRTNRSEFTWSRPSAYLRLRAVRASCGSDAAVLATTRWRAAWPTRPL